MIDKYHLIFRFLLFSCLISIEYLATATFEVKNIEYSWDKLNHFVAFLVLYALISLAYKNLSILSRIGLLLLFAIQIELVQSFIPNRDFSMLDVVADMVGIIAGIFFCRFRFVERFLIRCQISKN